MQRTRKFCRQWDVWICKDLNILIIKCFVFLTAEKSSTLWTEEELVTCKNKDNFTFIFLKSIIATLVQSNVSDQQTLTNSSFWKVSSDYSKIEQCDQQSYSSITYSSVKPSTDSTSKTSRSQDQQQLSFSQTSTFAERRRQITVSLSILISQHSSHSNSNIRDHTRSRYSGHDRKIQTLMKDYSNEFKYSDQDDNFVYKMIIFHDICNQTDVLSKALLKAFLVMLKELALNYWYSNIKSWDQISLNHVYNKIKAYFEDAEYKRFTLFKFNVKTFKSIIAKNQEKFMSECLQILIKDLRHLQHELDSKFRNDHFFNNKLIIACQNVSACQYACFKSSDHLVDLINDLQSLITIFVKNDQTQHISYLVKDSINDDNNAYFIDRRFHRYFNRFENNFRRQIYESSVKKRCFVCEKKKCWSFKHIRNERDQTKAKFKKRMNQRFEKRASQYIFNYEERNDDSSNDDDDLNQHIKILMIDVSHSVSFSSIISSSSDANAYMIAFEKIEYLETMLTKLINKLFNHDLKIISSFEIIVSESSFSNQSDLFIYMIKERYSFSKFSK